MDMLYCIIATIVCGSITAIFAVLFDGDNKK